MTVVEALAVLIAAVWLGGGMAWWLFSLAALTDDLDETGVGTAGLEAWSETPSMIAVPRDTGGRRTDLGPRSLHVPVSSSSHRLAQPRDVNGASRLPPEGNPDEAGTGLVYVGPASLNRATTIADATCVEDPHPNVEVRHPPVSHDMRVPGRSCPRVGVHRGGARW